MIELRHPARGPALMQFELRGADLIQRYGRVGYPLQTRVRSLASAQDARKAHDRAIRRLLGRGYQIGAHHPGLIEAIAAEPDDPGGYLVYADWLAARDDPRAALIRATLEPRRSASVRAHLARHPFHFVHPAWPLAELTWWMGFVRRMDTDQMVTWGPAAPTGETPISNYWLADRLCRLRRHPSGRFLRVLRARHWHRGVWRIVTGRLRFAMADGQLRVYFNARFEPFDVHTVSRRELRTIPGIGARLAERIVAFRDAHRPLTHVARLGEVRGVGPATLAQLSDALTI